MFICYRIKFLYFLNFVNTFTYNIRIMGVFAHFDIFPNSLQPVVGSGAIIVKIYTISSQPKIE